MDDALTYLLSFVRASTRAAADAKATQRDSAMDDEQWWVANAHAYHFGLERVLDGLAVLIDNH